MPYCVLEGPLDIGNNNWIGPHVVIGQPATDTKKIQSKGSKIIIGNSNIIREFTTIEQPCYCEYTIIGDDVFIMQNSCIGHDVHVHPKAVITNNSVVAGMVNVLEGANIAMGTTINQKATVGHYSIVASNCACMKNVKPFSRFIPNQPISVNIYAIEKYGFQKYEDEIHEYVLNGTPVKSSLLKKITDQFDDLAKKNNYKTY